MVSLAQNDAISIAESLARLLYSIAYGAYSMCVKSLRFKTPSLDFRKSVADAISAQSNHSFAALRIRWLVKSNEANYLQDLIRTKCKYQNVYNKCITTRDKKKTASLFATMLLDGLPYLFSLLPPTTIISPSFFFLVYFFVSTITTRCHIYTMFHYSMYCYLYHIQRTKKDMSNSYITQNFTAHTESHRIYFRTKLRALCLCTRKSNLWNDNDSQSASVIQSIRVPLFSVE